MASGVSDAIGETIPRQFLRTPAAWALPLFGFAPLLLISVVASLEQTRAAFVIYFALAWTAYFFVWVADNKPSLPLGLGVAVFTVGVGVPVGTLLTGIPPLSSAYGMASESTGVRQLAAFIFADGLNEELLKALALWVVAFGLRRMDTPSDGVFYGALAGLGFAVFEGYRAIAIAPDSREMARQMLLRTTALPLVHATFTGVNGYFIAMPSANRRDRVALCAAGLGVAAILHGVYDFGSEVWRFFLAAAAHLVLISRARQ